MLEKGLNFMKVFYRGLGTLLAVVMLFVLVACGSSGVDVNSIKINTTGVDTQMVVGAKQTLSVELGLSDPDKADEVSVTWSILEAPDVADIAKLTPSGNSTEIEALGVGSVTVTAEAGGQSDTIDISVVVDPCQENPNALTCPTGDTDGDGTKNEDDDFPEDPCQPDNTVKACTDTIDDDDDGTVKTDDPDDSDPCNPDNTVPACKVDPADDKDGDGVKSDTDPDDNDPCNPNDDIKACTDTIDDDKDGTVKTDDPDDSDPCNPDNTVPACKVDPDDKDGDGVKSDTDPDDNDPCNPNDDIKACTDTIDDDKDGTVKTDDPDDSDPCNPDNTVPVCKVDPDDKDGDGVKSDTDPDDNDPCNPNDDIKACTDTIDDDKDGTVKTDDPDDSDPCEPNDDVEACTDTIDDDKDGTSKTDDPDDSDPCNPDDDVKACTDTIDDDKDGTVKTDDPDDSDPCNPDDTVPACIDSKKVEFNFASIGCDENTAVGATCEVVIDLRKFSGKVTAFEFKADVADQGIFDVTKAEVTGATSSTADWTVLGDEEDVLGFGPAIDVTQTVQIAKLTLMRKDTGTTSITIKEGILTEEGSDNEVNVTGRQRTLGK